MFTYAYRHVICIKVITHSNTHTHTYTPTHTHTHILTIHVICQMSAGAVGCFYASAWARRWRLFQLTVLSFANRLNIIRLRTVTVNSAESPSEKIP